VFTPARVFTAARRSAVAVMTIAVIVVTWWGWSTLQDVQHGLVTTHILDPGLRPSQAPLPPGAKPPPPPVPGTDILLVGIDSRRDAQGNPLPANVFALLNAGVDGGTLNTDTMMLVHIPQGGGVPSLISFPRDTYVQIAGGFGSHKLNSAYAYARNAEVSKLVAQGQTDMAAVERQADDAGRANLVATLENLMGGAVTINRYAEINLYGFYLISQAIGGVPVCVKQAVTDPHDGASFPAGTQLLSGTQALNFVRQRYGLAGGDLDRVKRQQVFLASAAKTMLSAGTLSDPGRLGALEDAIHKSVVLSDGWDITSFAEQVAGLAGGDVKLNTIPISGSARNGDGDVLLVDQPQVAQFVRSVVSSGTTPSAAPAWPAGTTPAHPASLALTGLPCVS
jgi:LCP family protein required for cell wall assembly